MNNPIVQTDIAEILQELKQEIKEIRQENRISNDKTTAEFKSINDKMTAEFKSINDKMTAEFKSINDKLNSIALSQGKLEQKVENQQSIITEVKNSAYKQIWALIGLVFTAIVSLIIGLGKFIFFPNP